MVEKISSNPNIIIIAPVIAVLATVQASLVFLLGLIVVDLITGIMKAFKAKEIKLNPFNRVFWQTINSEGLRSTWKKSTEYGLGIIVTAFCQALFFPTFTISILGGSFSILLFVVMAACLIEIYSIFENINKINPDNAIQKIIRFIQKYFKAYVTDILTKLKSGK
jgi:hypothetical protein